MDAIYESFLLKGKLVYQKQRPLSVGLVIVIRAVQQADGSWWQYVFYKGRNPGTPCRGKARQAKIIEFVNKVKAELN